MVKSNVNPDAPLPQHVMAERVKVALSCSDCKDIPKVPGAGDLVNKGGQELQRMHNGVLVKQGTYHGDWMTEIIRGLKGHHEPQEERVFHAVVKTLAPGATMLELGSFWAYYSMWFQHEIPDAVSIMVEPDPRKLQAGKDHFALNRFSGTFIHAFAGAETAEKAKFVDWDGREILLPQVSVDGLMHQYQLETLDILHADIQGAEYLMLNGASKALSERRIKYLFISTHGFEHRRCLRLIRQHGYRILAEHTVLESVSGDGLIVAASPDRALPTAVPISKKSVPLRDWVRYELANVKNQWLR